MGKTIVSAARALPAFHYIGGIAHPDRSDEGLIDIPLALQTADVIVDFSTAAAATALARQCAEHGGPALVIGATGFETGQLREISEAARKIAIVRSGNFSIGLNILTELISHISRTLPPETWDIEIVETHHRRKVDAPSGTALMLGEAAAGGRGTSLRSVERRGRDGLVGERPAGEIGFSVVRGGGVVGEHSVIFAADDEVITISHSALRRDMFARGALTAARWVIGRKPGEYAMSDVLKLP